MKTGGGPQPLRAFFSYAHEDDRVYTRLRVGPSGRGAPDPPEKAPRKGAKYTALGEFAEQDLERADVRGAHRLDLLPGVRGATLGFRVVWGSAPGLD